MNEEDLVELHKKGDPNAFSTLMRQSLSSVYNFVRAYVRSDEEAEDIVQDTFLKAWKHARRFDATKKWRPWIFSIARNTALDYIKKKKAVPFSGIDMLDTENTIEFGDTLEDTEPLAAELFEHVENNKKMAEAITKLRPEYNSVLMLHYHQELTFEEIAITLSIPMNTAKSWHRRALIELKTLLHSIAPK